MEKKNRMTKEVVRTLNIRSGEKNNDKIWGSGVLGVECLMVKSFCAMCV